MSHEQHKDFAVPEDLARRTDSLFNLEKLKELGGLKAGDVLAVDPELESKFMQHIGRTVKHDRMTSNLVLKTGLSAYTKEPLNLFLRGESSIGKTYVVVNSLTNFPKEDVWFLGGLSPTALVHDRGLLVDEDGEPIIIVSKPDKDATEEEKDAYREFKEKIKTAHYVVDLQDRILVFVEAPNIETFNKLRPVLSHDVFEISYKFTDTGQKGALRTTHVVLRGWPATIFCSTSERFIQDLATRSFTFTPETTEAKFKDANVLTGSKAAFPWKFEKDQDDVLLEAYIAYFKAHVQELEAIVPYAAAFANTFPARFPRSMRDFKHVLGLIQVSALFHLAQRPILVRKLKDMQRAYVLATKTDYDNTLALWQEIRETTETSAASHHLRFFHEVVEPMAKEKVDSLLTVKDLTDSWNAKFPDRKSSDTIRNWVDFLCLIGYMSKIPNPADKRENLLEVIQEKNGECTQNDLSVFFSLESFKAWLNEAQSIIEENKILLRENLVDDAETTPEAIYTRHFSDENQDSSVNVLSPNEGPSAESVQEKTDNQKSVQNLHSPQILQDLASKTQKLGRLMSDFGENNCQACGRRVHMEWQVTEHDGSWGLLCSDCGLKLEKLIAGEQQHA
ncbi:MAG: hypothetical protein WCD81_10370 [Candidatus Bathyarchaeia archaeon]